MASDKLPKTLVEAIRYFSDIDVCTEYVAKLRWADGPECPRCGSGGYSYLTSRRLWKCKDCKKQYSVKVGTIFEDSPIPLDKWLAAIWMIANAKNGVSSHEMGRSIGITQKSAWFMLHRIRLAMQTGSFERFDGETEADETFIGGHAKNMHRAQQAKVKRGASHMTPVAGVLRRNREGQSSRVQATVVPNTQRPALVNFVRTHVKRGSTLYTDEALAYRSLDKVMDHQTVNHRAGTYVAGRVSTNGIENFWALLKRGIVGTYVQVAPFHLSRYVDERVFTFNERDLSDLGRFSLVLHRVAGRRLTFAALTGKK